MADAALNMYMYSDEPVDATAFERYTAERGAAGDKSRYELIDGRIYAMSAPSTNHQGLLTFMAAEFGNFFKGKPCRPFVAPVDVRLQRGDERCLNAVQPDLFVLCDKSKDRGNKIVGAPDLVVEIVSPSSGLRDRVFKYNKYVEFGVREYWIVDAKRRRVSQYYKTDIITDGGDDSGAVFEEYTFGEIVTSGVFEGLSVDFAAYENAYGEGWGA